MLALWLWGIDVLIWRKSRINHVFIFNFNPTTALQYHSIFTVHIHRAPMAALGSLLVVECLRVSDQRRVAG